VLLRAFFKRIFFNVNLSVLCLFIGGGVRLAVDQVGAETMQRKTLNSVSKHGH
jgi:hypothetical protein